MRNTTDPNPATAVDAYSPYHDGGLDTVPAAYAAYVDHHQRQWL